MNDILSSIAIRPEPWTLGQILLNITLSFFLGLFVACGSDFDDSLIGDAADNVLYGGAGNDTLIGNSGNDMLAGGG